MNEYNLLTEELLLAGFTQENYPEYVIIPAGSSGEKPLDNGYGGFEFKRDYLNKLCYQTGCGLSVRAENCINDMSYMGITWCYENDNVLIKCPYYKKDCKSNHPILVQMQNFCFCTCHMADQYDYGNSIERILKEKDAEKEKLYQRFIQEHNGKVCRNHMFYEPKEKRWELRYDPIKCAKRCSFGYCPMRTRMLVKEKGNVFYDVRVSTLRKDGSLFDGEPIVSMLKGKKFLERQVSMDICRAIAASGKDAIFSKEWWNGYSMCKMYDPDLEIEILNIRAERRECRDLEQDLEDIRNGIAVVHESDRIKAEKEKKQFRKQKRLERLERKIAKNGYGALNDAEKRLAGKLIGIERIKILEEKKSSQPEANQLSLAMWMEM